ncbi:MAG: tetratricopeptide repeat protein [Bacteroidota bacterium]|nr:tetratricopeptide repeat protein [Bacteroidota bacterium]
MKYLSKSRIVFKQIFLILLLLQLHIPFSFSQTSYIDSLSKVLNNTKSDLFRVKLMNDLCRSLSDIDYDKAKNYGEQALSISKKIGNKTEEALAYNNLGLVYYYLGDYNTSLKYYNISLEIRTANQDKNGIASSLMNIGLVYDAKAEYGKALNYHFKSLRIWEESNDKTGISKAYNNIGKVYFVNKDYEEALKYYRKALKIKEELGDKNALATSYTNIGLIYEAKNDYNKALEFYKKSLSIMENQNNRAGVSKILTNMGNVYSMQKNYEKGLSCFQKSLNISSLINDKQGMINSLYNLGYLYIIMKEYSIAKDYLIKSLEMAKNIGDKDMIKQNYESLSETYAGLNDYKDAYMYHNKYSVLKDSIFNVKSSRMIAEMQTKYETEKKEKEIEILVKDKNVKDLQLKKTRILIYAFIVGFILAFILTIVIYRGYHHKKRANLLLEHKNKIIAKKNKDILSSIEYAKIIQQAILPSKELIKKLLPESFILYKPKDIVSGDFYWVQQKNGKIYFAAADCTGHGVPGAFMSIIGHDLLDQALNDKYLSRPSDILNYISLGIHETFHNNGDEDTVKDGMDIALCALDMNTLKLEYSGAYNPLHLIRNKDLQEFKGERIQIGLKINSEIAGFNTQEIQLIKGDTLYVFSDGYSDQFGGTNGKKFMAKRFRETLLKIQDLPIEDQGIKLNEIFQEWRGDQEQVDDILIMGVRV